MAKIPDIFNSTRMKLIDKKLDSLSKELAQVTASRVTLLKSQLVSCPYCEKKHAVGDLHAIRGMRYHKSYSSYEDSTWEADGTYYTVCPSCYKLSSLDEVWALKFASYFHQCREGSLQIRKHGEDRLKRADKVSVMVANNDRTYGYTEVLVPYETIGRATNGKLHNFNIYR
jgi:hypothetical protein